MRYQKKTVLFVGEGKTEKAFLLFLWDEFGFIDSINPRIEYAYGGSPKDVVRYCIRKSQNLSFDERVILIDGDLEFNFDPDLVKEMSVNPKIEIISTKPCIEGLFLKILNDPAYNDKMQTGTCRHILMY